MRRRPPVPPRILRNTTTVVACPYEPPWHRTGVLAALEDRNAGRKRGFVSIDTLDKAPAASGHVVDKLRLVQPQTIKVDDVHIGAEPRHQPTPIRKTKKVRSFARLPFDQMLNRQPWPAVSVSTPMRQHETRQT